MKERQKERKRYIWLLLITGVAISAMFLYKTAVNESIPTVETAVVTRTTVSETAVCTGTVSAMEGIEVFVQVPCVAGKTSVEVGDTVKKGDILLEIDRTATLEMAVNAGLSEGQGGLASALIAQTVVAPTDGVVSAINAEEGELLSVSSPCVVLSQKGGVEIAVVIRESALSKIHVGQEVAVSGVAFDKPVYNGTLTEISSTARTRVSGTSTETVVDAVVTLSPQDVDESLLIGLSAKAVITVDEREDVLLLPYDCLTQDENGEMAVYCLNGDIAQRCAVHLGEELSDGVEVLGGLEEGAVVVKDPEQLSGQTVRVTVKAEVSE